MYITLIFKSTSDLLSTYSVNRLALGELAFLVWFVHLQICLWAGWLGKDSCCIFTAVCFFNVLVARLLKSLIYNSLRFPKPLLNTTFSFTCNVFFITRLHCTCLFCLCFFRNIKLFIFHGVKWKALFSAPLCLVSKWHCSLAGSVQLICKIYYTKHI